MNSLSRFVLALASAGLTAACAPTVASAPAPVIAPAPPVGAMGSTGVSTATAALSNDTHWARNSAEHKAIFLEVFRAAGNRLPALVSGHAAGTWGVILDADETVLDNSDYQKSRVPFGGKYDPAAWAAWVDQGTATALPGAVAFTARVRELGGKVAIVSNRDDAQCPVTRENLDRVGITNDVVLCKTTTGDKNPRFAAVQNGTASPTLPPLTVLEWVGDNIEDFPLLHQDVRSASDSAFARFGDTYFALPNAMYGSWERNPRQ